ncbi:MAG: hypothetical protein DCC68_26730 [Planctomycetota bacterium]|nr:MAG: hypothetical protein DCC68_26730 [Planctomycetota bacterium]
MIAHATPDAPRWTLESPLAGFLAAEFSPYIAELAPKRRGGNRHTVTSWLATFIVKLQRPPVLGDLNLATLDSIRQTFGPTELSAPESFATTFYAVWECAAKHVPLGPRPMRDWGRTGVAFHGPAKWSKAERNQLLAAAERVGGTFQRRLSDGSLVEIPRAVWFAAYVRIARATSLPFSRIPEIRCGDITTAGVLAVRPRRRGHPPEAFQLNKAARAACKPLLAEPGDSLLGVTASESSLRIWFRRVRAIAKLDSRDGYRLVLPNWKTDRPQRDVRMFDPVGVEKFHLDSPLGEFVRDCYLPQKFAIRSPKTRATYGMLVKQLTEALGRAPLVRDLTEENICRLLRWCESREMSPHTVEQRQHFAVALANFCSKRRLISWWVELPRYPTPDIVPDSWKVDEMNAIFAACAKMPGEYCGVPAPDWWRAFHCVLWDTGERTSAILAIEPQWLNVETRVLVIPGPARKGGRKAATYELKPHTIEALGPLLAACRESGRSRLFAFAGSSCTFYNHYTALLKAAGLPSGRKHKGQKIRRTFATFVELAGGNATEALGHSARRVTTEHYLDPRVIRKPAANLLLPDITGDEPKPDEPKGGAA